MATIEQITQAMENEFDGYPTDCIISDLLDLRAELDKSMAAADELCNEAKKQCGIACRLRDELFKHRWIPVSERPKKDGRYWVTDNVTAWVSWFSMAADVFSYEKFLISHWKPIVLPEQPPKTPKLLGVTCTNCGNSNCGGGNVCEQWRKK